MELWLTISIQKTMTNSLFQVTLTMISVSSTLTKEDLGLWCFLMKGRYHGFCSTRGEAGLLLATFVDQDATLINNNYGDDYAR